MKSEDELEKDREFHTQLITMMMNEMFEHNGNYKYKVLSNARIFDDNVINILDVDDRYNDDFKLLNSIVEQANQVLSDILKHK